MGDRQPYERPTLTPGDQPALIKAWLVTERASYESAQPRGNYLPGEWADWLIAEVERLSAVVREFQAAASMAADAIEAYFEEEEGDDLARSMLATARARIEELQRPPAERRDGPGEAEAATPPS